MLLFLKIFVYHFGVRIFLCYIILMKYFSAAPTYVWIFLNHYTSLVFPLFLSTLALISCIRNFSEWLLSYSDIHCYLGHYLWIVLKQYKFHCQSKKNWDKFLEWYLGQIEHFSYLSCLFIKHVQLRNGAAHGTFGKLLAQGQ